MTYKVVHYINQFYAGIGGEEKADWKPEVREGFMGPGMQLEKLLGSEAKIVATVICGDGFYGENTDEARATCLDMIKKYQPDLFIAGPAFNAGRYGFACGDIAATVGASALLLLHARIWAPPTAALAGLLLVYPLWSWRRLEATSAYMLQELRAFSQEPDLLSALAQAPMKGASLPRSPAESGMSRPSVVRLMLPPPRSSCPRPSRGRALGRPSPRSACLSSSRRGP